MSWILVRSQSTRAIRMSDRCIFVDETKLPSLCKLPQTLTQTRLLACRSSLPISSGTIRPRDGSIRVSLSASNLPQSRSKEKPTGESAPSSSSSRTVPNTLGKNYGGSLRGRQGNLGLIVIRQKLISTIGRS